MKILAIGDTHTYIDLINEHVNEYESAGHKVDFVLQVGDFGLYNIERWNAYRKGYKKFLKPTYVVHGNHEAPKMLKRAYQEKIENFHMLRKGEIVALTHKDEVIRVMGVGGAYSVDNPPEDEMIPFNSMDYTSARIHWENVGKPEIDILMTHECPYGVGLMGDPRIARMFNLPPNQIMGDEKLRDLWMAIRPKLQINGHHHRFHSYQEDGLQHITLGLGYDRPLYIDTETWELSRMRS